MIHHLRGRLVLKSPTFVVIECNGLGYEVHISLNTLQSLGSEEQVLLYTHPVYREDAQILYGFFTLAERDVFRKLISVSGIGAATARLILSSMTAEEVVESIALGDVNAFKRIKGIGTKSAERLLVDLRDKMNGISPSQTIPTGTRAVREEALAALEVLGFARNQADKVVAALLAEEPGLEVEAAIKLALKKL